MVYFVRCYNHDGSPTDFYKVGYTRDRSSMAQRLSSLQTGCPFSLKIVYWGRGDNSDEREIHRALANLRVIGEWFSIHPNLFFTNKWFHDLWFSEWGIRGGFVPPTTDTSRLGEYGGMIEIEEDAGEPAFFFNKYRPIAENMEWSRVF